VLRRLRTRLRSPGAGYDEIVRIIDELTDEGVIAVAFEGGEPLVRADFMDILRHTCAKAFVLVRTNATLITEDVARQFKAVGVGTVIVDLWGATAATHDRLTGTAGSFEQALAGARAVIDQGSSYFSPAS
jgi:MoaA/NifB/PqqE/SkfB family radical SAM enzyme